VTIHIPVLPTEVFEGKGDTCVDGTLGGGGHSREILNRIGANGRLIGLDRDPLAVEDTETRITDDNATLIASNYADLPEILQQLEIENVNSALLDLGLSSDQLSARDRGFSFNSDGPLDLRFNMMHGEPAFKLLNRLREKPLADLLYEFGEEKVNEELKWLGNALRRYPDCLAPGGRFVVISFHSLEDRMVKHAFAQDERLKVLTSKPITASEEELDANPRSRSAKLRVAERV